MSERPLPAAAPLAAAATAAGEELVPQRRGAWQANVVATGATVVAYLGTDHASRTRITAEQRRLRWASAAGVPVPAVRAADPSGAWLLVERVPDDEAYGTDYVEAAVRAAALLAAAGPVPADAGSPRPRRGRRQDRLLRVIRGVLSPLHLREFVELRRDVAELTGSQPGARVTCHGDFHIGNVLSDRGKAVHVIDFEFLGPGHPAEDLMSLWVDLTDADDRDRLLELAVDALPVPRAEVLVVAHWLAVRHLAELVTGVSLRRRDRPEVSEAVRRIEQARALRATG